MSKLDENILAYRANDFVEARALAAHLDEAGVHARVVGDFLDGAYGGIRAGSMLGTEVWIPVTEAATAEPLLAAWQAEYHGEPMDPAPLKLRFSMRWILVLVTVVAFVAAVLGLIYRLLGMEKSLDLLNVLIDGIDVLAFVTVIASFFWILRRKP